MTYHIAQGTLLTIPEQPNWKNNLKFFTFDKGLNYVKILKT